MKMTRDHGVNFYSYVVAVLSLSPLMHQRQLPHLFNISGAQAIKINARG